VVNLSNVATEDNHALRQLILDRIRSSGPIPFSEFLELALYHPRYGYYFACDPSLDYRSSPNVHPVFGAALARQLAAYWQQLGRPATFEVFEAGAGSCRLAADILGHLSQAEPELYAAIRYVVQDVTLTPDSAPARLDAAGVPEAKVDVAAALPETPSIFGCILSNELLDALPFRRVRKRGGVLYELLVGEENGRFVDVEAEPRPEVRAYFEALGLEPAEGCDGEVNLVAPAWMTRAARALRRGFLLTLDYGYEAQELFAPWRRRGTLLTFYRHTASDDPYVRIGRQDLTASVDFTTVRRAAESAGMRTLAFTSQSEFLAGLGIGEALRQPPPPDRMEAYVALRRAVIELTDPSGLGRIRVLMQAKGAV